MKLYEYLNSLNIDRKTFSLKTGITEPTLRNILLGREPRLSTALIIEKETMGVVACEDLVVDEVKMKGEEPVSETGCLDLIYQ